MKKVVLLLTMVLAFNLSNAQDEVFKVIQGKKLITYAAINEEAQHVIEAEGKTAIELYNATMVMIGDIWKNPNEVIVGNVEGEYIKVNGGTNTVSFVSILTYYLPTRATFTFRFKDGKMMYQISNFEAYSSPTKYSSGGWGYWRIQRTSRNGKEVAGARENIDGFKNMLTSIEASITNNLNTELKSDW